MANICSTDACAWQPHDIGLSSSSSLAHLVMCPVLLVSKVGAMLLIASRCHLFWYWCLSTCSEVANTWCLGHWCLYQWSLCPMNLGMKRLLQPVLLKVSWWQEFHYCGWQPGSPLRLIMANIEGITFTTEIVVKQLIQIPPPFFAIVPIIDNSGMSP